MWKSKCSLTLHMQNAYYPKPAHNHYGSTLILNRYHHHHHHHISVMELGHLLTCSSFTFQEVSSKVCHDSFWRLGNSVSLTWVNYYKAFCLYVVSSFSSIPVIYPKLVLLLIPLHFVYLFCNLLKCILLFLNRLQNKYTKCKRIKNNTNLDKLLEYKSNWIQHVNKMPRNRLPRVMKHYSPTGRRNHGYTTYYVWIWVNNPLSSTNYLQMSQTLDV